MSTKQEANEQKSQPDRRTQENSTTVLPSAALEASLQFGLYPVTCRKYLADLRQEKSTIKSSVYKKWVHSAGGVQAAVEPSGLGG